MSDFVREVDEDLRQDQFRRFLSRYWVVLAAVAVLILAGVGAWRAYDYITTRRAQAAGGQYLDAIKNAQDGKGADLPALEKVAQDGTPGYRLLARFRLAAETGRTDAAAGAKLFDAIATDSAVDPALQNLARMRATLLLVDVLPYAEFKQRAEPLADANNIMRNSARELLAVAALKAGQNDDASRYIDAIEADQTAPATLRQRAQAMASLVRAAQKPASTPAAAAPAEPVQPPASPAPPAPGAPAGPTAPPASPPQ